MKLRVRGDSLRFRLTQGEVSSLLAKKKVSESIHFSSSGEDVLIYSLQILERASEVRARFVNGEIVVDLPMILVESWAATNQVGIEYAQPTSEGRQLRIVVEKDFRCLLPRPEEDESDNFPNPEKSSVR